MKKNIIILIILMSVASLQQTGAQIIKQKDITDEQIQAHLKKLARKDDSASKAGLLSELKALVNSGKENYMRIAAERYGYLGMDSEEAAVNKATIERFPKGILARARAFPKFAENTSLSAADMEKQYQQWLSDFPVSNFEPKEHGIYQLAVAELAIKFGLENNQKRLDYYFKQLRSKPSFLKNTLEIASTLSSANKDKLALPILEEAFNAPKPFAGADKGMKDDFEIYYGEIKWSYARALIETGQTDKGLDLFYRFKKEEPGAGNYDWRNPAAYAKGLAAKGKAAEAFQLLHNYLVDNGRNRELEKIQRDIYLQVNGDKGDFIAYLKDLGDTINKAELVRIKSEMFKKQAPLFALEDRKGKLVSLADLRGKVVVLDFWATWCCPCKESFPAMQVAVNKYKDDPDVVFLFISTSERGNNYKQVAGEYIDTNKFTFHVLFDEMNNNGKATASTYNVKSIPTKVVIDKEGFIRFQSSGSISDIDKLVYELSTKIELARKDSI